MTHLTMTALRLMLNLLRKPSVTIIVVLKLANTSLPAINYVDSEDVCIKMQVFKQFNDFPHSKHQKFALAEASNLVRRT